MCRNGSIICTEEVCSNVQCKAVRSIHSIEWNLTNKTHHWIRSISRMKNMFVYRTHAVQYVRLERCANSTVIKVIRCIMNMTYGTRQHANIVHVDGIIVSYVKVFNVNINFVSNMKLKRNERTVAAFHVDWLNNVIIRIIFFKYESQSYTFRSL
jgi:hypothetical protein